MTKLYKLIDLPSEEPVQYVGVYVMHWGKESEPTVAFREATEEEETKAKYVALMKEQVVDSAGGDYDTTHKEADDLLCRLLQELGYSEVVDEFKKVGKWYA